MSQKINQQDLIKKKIDDFINIIKNKLNYNINLNFSIENKTKLNNYVELLNKLKQVYLRLIEFINKIRYEIDELKQKIINIDLMNNLNDINKDIDIFILKKTTQINVITTKIGENSDKIIMVQIK